MRADSGKYYDHFLQYGVISLGHLNCLSLSDTIEGEAFRPNEDQLAKSFFEHHEREESKQQRASVHYAQVKQFIFDMTVGDWVLTIGNNYARFGRIVGRPYIRTSLLSIVYDEDTGHRVDMDHNLRRHVQWGPGLPRKDLPYGLIRSLKANQTLFNLDKNWTAIYHTLYPAFRKDNHLYLSAKIKATDSIRNHDIAAIFSILNDVEIIGKEISQKGNIDDLEKMLDYYLAQNLLSITTKAQFHSPGEIWNEIVALAGQMDLNTWATNTFVAYSMLFGNKLLGLDGLIDLQTRQKIWDIILERLQKNRAENAVVDLKLEMPSHDTAKLESPDVDEN